MARYRPDHTNQGHFISVSFAHQIYPESFPFALHQIIESMDLSCFDERFRNDDTGAPAYRPKILLKIVLLAYSLGIISSREIERECQTNTVFMGMSGFTRPHYSTIAKFISSMEKEIVPLFLRVVAICADEGLIGQQMFAIDGCKISANCSKEWSGTREDFAKKKEKLERSIEFLVRKHQEVDTDEERRRTVVGSVRKREEKAIERLRAKVKKIGGWLAEGQDKLGTRGKALQSNLTDPESAKLHSSRGKLQGYNGVAAVDDKHQVIVAAEAYGEATENHLLDPMIRKVGENLESAAHAQEVEKKAVFLADSGFHCEAEMKKVIQGGVNAYVADNQFRKRDPRFATAGRHKTPRDKAKTKRGPKYFPAEVFQVNPATGKLVCPAGKELYVKNRNFQTRDRLKGIAYQGRMSDCQTCELRPKCMRSKKSPSRQVVKFDGRVEGPEKTYTQQMIEKMDTEEGRHAYSRRMGIVEPVFANLRNCLGLDRFTLRGKVKVGIQWKLYAIVHNVGKIFRYSPRFAT